MTDRFTRDNGIGRVLLDWWEKLNTDRAARAVLRRAPSVTAVAFAPPYQRLYRRLCGAGWIERTDPSHNDSLAAAIGLIAHVEQDDVRRSPARAMSQGDEDAGRPPVSELRFRRLLESPDLDALFTGLRRAMPLMNHRVDVLELTNDVVHWDDAVKKRWAYEYDWPEKSGT